MTARIAPFAAYLAFIAVAEILQHLDPLPREPASWSVLTRLWLYPVKTAVVLGLLLVFWKAYEELQSGPIVRRGELPITVLAGLLVYLGWVRMDWPWAMQGHSPGYDPFQAGPQMGALLAGVRLFGAAAVVPVMEELFWRSFLIRYLISTSFQSVKLGTVTPFSLGVSLILFAVEHDQWLAGLMAGAVYTWLWYRTQRLWPCILAHGLTNLLLGVHVLLTHDWRYW